MFNSNRFRVRARAAAILTAKESGPSIEDPEISGGDPAFCDCNGGTRHIEIKVGGLSLPVLRGQEAA